MMEMTSMARPPAPHTAIELRPEMQILPATASPGFQRPRAGHDPGDGGGSERIRRVAQLLRSRPHLLLLPFEVLGDLGRELEEAGELGAEESALRLHRLAGNDAVTLLRRGREQRTE